jgi:hypothetical protein
MSDRDAVYLRGMIRCLWITLVACSAEPQTLSTSRPTTSSAGARATAPAQATAGGTAPAIGASTGGSPGAANVGAAGRASPSAASTPPVTAPLQPSAAGGSPASASRGGAGALATAAAGSGASAPASGNPSTAPVTGACTGPALAPVTDYGAKGPFDTMTVSNTGPSGAFTMFRPRELGANGFLHPPATWGNGVSTTPDLYTDLLNTVASHGFVVIASNSTAVTAQDVRSGLEWLIMQNDSGDLQGKLAVKCAAAIGYSMGGGAAVGAAAHPNVIATVSLHGLQGAASQLNGPLLLITSTNDGFVTKAQFVKPTYDGSSKVPTIMATLNVPGATPDFNGHLIPLGDAGDERAPLIAWLRLFVYGDEAAKPWFYGSDCTLCKEPWTDIQKKNGNFD